MVENADGQDTKAQASTGSNATGDGTQVAATYPRGEGLRAERPNRLAPGSRLLNNKFELQQPLGEGGMGVVFRAVDLEAARLRDPNPYLAIKVLNDSIRSMPQATVALQRECSRARGLAHPNIIRVYEFYEEECFITMELLQGRSWASMLGEYPQGMSVEQARPLVTQLCSALTYAHTRPRAVVHSDLKPQNLFVTTDNQVKVLDFGIAAQLRQETADSHKTFFDARELGALSPPYASLEMWQRMQADPRDDVYSLGCIVYELLSGMHPFKGATALQAFTQELKPDDIPSLNRRQNGALRHALQLPRPQRTASVAEFVREFFGARAEKLLPSMGWRLPALGALAVIGVGGLLVPLRQHQHTTAEAPSGAVTGMAAAELARFLGATVTFESERSYTRSEVRSLLAAAPRRVQLGSTDGEIDDAVALCLQFSTSCARGAYADEEARQPLLKPFLMDRRPVTVNDFRTFASSTGYQSDAERARGAYGVTGRRMYWVPSGSWRNAVGHQAAAPDAAVVGVTFHDAQEYCRWSGMRLPSEDEWEYTARGPQRFVFPWGNEFAAAGPAPASQPGAGDGPAEGIGGLYRGLARNVWQWVDTQGQGGAGRRVLKGGSWLEHNPADNRAAARRSEVPTLADSDSGFRCARTVDSWPDADFWVRSRL